MTSRTGLAEQVLEQMLERIRLGEWRPGMTLPGQRQLVEEFGVSRVPLREALSMLKALGIIEIQHGRNSVIRRMETDVVHQLFPLVFSLDGEHTYVQIFELRLAVESRTAYLAAKRRTDEHVERLEENLAKFREQCLAGSRDFYQTDLEFHTLVADATGNPLFPLLLKTFSGFVIFSQKEGCRDSAERHERAVRAHESICDAISEGDPERARIEMESHLRFSASRRAKNGSTGAL
jgi:GntR family transcriptional repressor for pyruvate dehydrogenase complex